MTVPEARFLAAGGSEGGVHFLYTSWPRGGCHIHRGRCLEGSAFFSGPKSRHSARGSHGTYSVGREKSGTSDGLGIRQGRHPERQ